MLFMHIQWIRLRQGWLYNILQKQDEVLKCFIVSVMYYPQTETKIFALFASFMSTHLVLLLDAIKFENKTPSEIASKFEDKAKSMYIVLEWVSSLVHDKCDPALQNQQKDA